MRFGAHRNQDTYPAAYQPRISSVDGQATFFELDRQNMRIHELFRGYPLSRNYQYRPALPEHRRRQLEELAPATVDPKAASSIEGRDMKERQKLYGLETLRTRSGLTGAPNLLTSRAMNIRGLSI